MFERILVATDFSPASAPAFEQAIRLAKSQGAALLVTHACQQLVPMELGYAPPAVYDDWEQKLREGVEKKLQPMVERARQEGIEARGLVVTGFVDEAILDAARQNRADLIVIGTHGRRGAARLFLGSVASRVVAAAACPVMTVRA